MSDPVRTKYSARYAGTADDVRAAQALRAHCFRGQANGDAGASADADGFDARARHVLIEETRTSRLVCCFRLLSFADGSEIAGSYSAQFYGLSGLGRYAGPMLELGRFCIAGGARDPEVLRVAWAALTAHVEEAGVGLIFGCSSFSGTETDAYTEAFALLKDRHLAPRRWRPRVKAPSVFCFARRLRGRVPDIAAAMRAMPPLLRSYLAMGGWVSDHAVVDRDLGTLHVFTALEIAALPPARARRLRALAG